jgi:hypothetical protein
METEMLEYLRRNWGWIVLRGVSAILFGVLALARPGITLGVLVIMWGAYAIVDGILSIVAGLQIRDHGGPLWSLFVVGALGSLPACSPSSGGASRAGAAVAIASWSHRGRRAANRTAIRLRKVIEGEWALAGGRPVRGGVGLSHPAPGLGRAVDDRRVRSGSASCFSSRVPT